MSWPREPGARFFSCPSRVPGVSMRRYSDHEFRLLLSIVCLIQNTLPPVLRTAAASLLTLGTISTATGT